MIPRRLVLPQGILVRTAGARGTQGDAHGPEPKADRLSRARSSYAIAGCRSVASWPREA